MRPPSPTVHHFEVTLQEVEPPIWREIQVPSNYSFWDLHVAIQDAMGWLDYHLHGFEIINPETGELQRIGIPDEEFLDEHPTLAGWEIPISDYFSKENLTATYIYDFGDYWQHTVTLKDVEERSSGTVYPRCIAGARARPTFPDWPYTHFTMVHATTPEGCEQINNEISEATGITERMVLYSTREYKKTRVRYFVPDYDEYLESEHPDAVITA